MRRETHWDGLERLIYYVMFPALLIETLLRADLSKVPVLGVGGALLLSALLMSLLCLALRPAARAARHRRPGLHVAVPGRDALADLRGARGCGKSVRRSRARARLGRDGGDDSGAQCAQRVGARALRLAGGAAGRAPIVMTIARNPLIWACFIGLALNRHRPAIPQPAHAFVDALGRSSLALGLLIVGAGLHLEGVFAEACAAIGVLSQAGGDAGDRHRDGAWFGLSGTNLAVVACCASVPASSNSYVLARQMGGDAPLMAQILTLQTVLAAITMPIVIALVATRPQGGQAHRKETRLCR